MWFEKEPYAVLSITPTLKENSGGISTKGIKSSLTIANYTPVDSQDGPVNPPNLEMTVCVDFSEKDRHVGQVYLSFYLQYIYPYIYRSL